jgi:hypothetical protein
VCAGSRRSLDELGVERDTALGHAAERAKILSNQRHGRLALLDQHVRLDLRKRGASHGAKSYHHTGCDNGFLHYVLLRFSWGFSWGPT